MKFETEEENYLMDILYTYESDREDQLAKREPDVLLTKWSAMNRGNALSMEKMGLNYFGGHVVPQNYDLALYYMEHSGLRGNPRAMLYCGIANTLGLGTEVNYDVAYWWLNRAREAGNETAKFLLELNVSAMNNTTTAQEVTA